MTQSKRYYSEIWGFGKWMHRDDRVIGEIFLDGDEVYDGDKAKDIETKYRRLVQARTKAILQ
jgi:hypothetical protein